MRKILFLVAMLATSMAFGQQKWTVDPSHSSVKFNVSHLVVSEVDGRFTKFSGNIDAPKPDFINAKINFTVDVNSINTDNERRDGHLKSADFFDAEKFPSMTFNSTSFKKVKNNLYLLEGDLTIKGVTKKVKFNVTYNGTLTTPKGAVAGFKATTTINRFDYGLKWNNLLENGNAVVGNEVTISLNLEFKLDK